MTCNDCANFSLQADERMAKQGYGRCKHREAHRSVSHNKPACDQYRGAPAEVVERRIAWMKGSK